MLIRRRVPAPSFPAPATAARLRRPGERRSRDLKRSSPFPCIAFLELAAVSRLAAEAALPCRLSACCLLELPPDPPGPPPDRLYPVNAARNAALARCATPLALLFDVDFLPCPSFQAALHDDADLCATRYPPAHPRLPAPRMTTPANAAPRGRYEDLLRGACEERRAFVVPAFEAPPAADNAPNEEEEEARARERVARALRDPRGRAAVGEMLQRGELIPFAQGAPRRPLVNRHRSVFTLLLSG